MDTLRPKELNLFAQNSFDQLRAKEIAKSIISLAHNLNCGETNLHNCLVDNFFLTGEMAHNVCHEILTYR